MRYNIIFEEPPPTNYAWPRPRVTNSKTDQFRRALRKRPDKWAVWSDRARSSGESSLAASRLGVGFEGTHRRNPDGTYKVWVRFVR